MSSFKVLTLFVGDPFLAEEKFQNSLGEIRKKIAGEIPVQTFRLFETPLESILTEARTLPFLAPAQIFRIKDAERLKKGDLEILGEYLTRPSQTTFIFFEAQTLEKKGGLADLIGSAGAVCYLDEDQKQASGLRLIQEKLKMFDKTITPAARQELMGRMGDTPVLLDSVLEQLIQYAGSEKEITEDMVESFAEKTQTPDGFQLINALAGQNKPEALRVLKELLAKNDEDVISLLGLLHWQLRRFWLGRTLLEEGTSENVLLKRCGIYPKQAPFFMRQIRRFSLKGLERAVEGLFQMDWKLKTGRTEGPAALEAWVCEITS
ncbi:MAG: DNA polymerase III subunit delta [Candidatus Omnitrophica bacterium]|nr:DNA polymerase III subunit delta [Candidatus Omnitrophota bacterium]